MDEIDINAPEQWALLYLVDWFEEGIWPDIHGLYPSLQDAELARRSKLNPEKYFVRKAYTRNT